jgi:hypothetical protein
VNAPLIFSRFNAPEVGQSPRPRYFQFQSPANGPFT